MSADDADRPPAAEANPAAPVNRNVARGAATRTLLLEVATRAFAAHGYEDTSIESVLVEAGVSRGSLYHHFAGKEALFEAVLEEMENDIGQRVTEAAGGATDPAEILRLGGQAWVRLAGDPVVRQVLLIDAPSVLGWDRWRALEERHALGLIKALIAMLADDGRVDPAMVDMLSHVILASINEIALMIALADDHDRAMAEGSTMIDDLLVRLLTL
jgi:AcrR family transcriptional regulator